MSLNFVGVILIVAVCLVMANFVFSQVLNQSVLDKELKNTIRDNALAQQGSNQGYSFPTNPITGQINYTGSNVQEFDIANCHCVCGDD